MGGRSTRRCFMVQAGRAAALLPAALAVAHSRTAAREAAVEPAPQEGEDFWQQVRQQFSFNESKVPMNAANLCPSPSAIARRVTQLTHDIDVDCSFNNREKFQALLERSRRTVAEQLNVTADEIALVRNTSEANNTVNNGLRLKAGDEIVLWDENHPTNNVAWDVRAARFGLIVKRVSTPLEPNVDQLVRAFVDAFSAKSRVLAITHVSNSSGLRLPVRQLCDAAHQRDIYVHVDGAQTWGALNVDLRQLGCDSYAASAHKWFVGPKEVGLLYVRGERIDEIWPNVVAPGWGVDIEPDVRGARKFESLGQRDDAALAAIADTVDFHRAIGSERIQQRVEQLATHLKTELQDAGLKLITPMDAKLCAGVCVIDVPQERRSEAFNTLYHQYGIAGATTGGLRLCPHIYNTLEHVERAAKGIKAMRQLIG